MNALDIIAFAEKNPRWNFCVNMEGEYVCLSDITATGQDTVQGVDFKLSRDDDGFEFYQVKASVGEAEIIGAFYFTNRTQDSDTQRDQAVAFFKTHGFLSDVKLSTDESF